MGFDRYWLLTSTTYGTWLPGDERGFVSPVETGTGPQRKQNVPGTPYDAGYSGYERSAAANLKCPPIYLSPSQAEAILAQFHETTGYRKWHLCAAAVMASHFHVVIGVPGDPSPESILRDYKAYASRSLNRRWKTPASNTWWTHLDRRGNCPLRMQYSAP